MRFRDDGRHLCPTPSVGGATREESVLHFRLELDALGLYVRCLGCEEKFYEVRE